MIFVGLNGFARSVKEAYDPSTRHVNGEGFLGIIGAGIGATMAYVSYIIPQESKNLSPFYTLCKSPICNVIGEAIFYNPLFWASGAAVAAALVVDNFVFNSKAMVYIFNTRIMRRIFPLK